MSQTNDPAATQHHVTRSELLRLSGVFILWRICLFFMGSIAGKFLPYHPSFPYAEIMLEPSKLPSWIYSWANFDGVHYITIAQKGYVGTGLIQAFFPFFPALLLRPLYLLTNGHINILAVGLIITNLAALLAVIVWFAFLKTLFKPSSAWLGVFLLLLFPTSLFLVAFYTESIFFAAVIGAFLLARQKRWLLAGIVTMIATSTRVVGGLLIPALFIELWLQWQSTQSTKTHRLPFQRQALEFLTSQWQNLLAIALGSIGLLGYMFYLARTFGDPLYFLHVQSEFGAGRTEGFVMYPQVLWRSLKILLTLTPGTLRYYTSILEFLAGSLGLLGLLVAAMKVRLSYLIFALGAFFMPTFTGTFSSMPRYILVCFPLYLLMILWLERRPRMRAIVLVVCSVVVAVNTVIFIQGYWLS